MNPSKDQLDKMIECRKKNDRESFRVTFRQCFREGRARFGVPVPVEDSCKSEGNEGDSSFWEHSIITNFEDLAWKKAERGGASLSGLFREVSEAAEEIREHSRRQS